MLLASKCFEITGKSTKFVILSFLSRKRGKFGWLSKNSEHLSYAQTSSTHVFQQLYASLGSHCTVHLFLRLLYSCLQKLRQNTCSSGNASIVMSKRDCLVSVAFQTSGSIKQSISLSRMPTPSGYCFLLFAPNIGLSVVFLFPSEVAHLKVNNGDDGAHKLHTYCK